MLPHDECTTATKIQKWVLVFIFYQQQVEICQAGGVAAVTEALNRPSHKT